MPTDDFSMAALAERIDRRMTALRARDAGAPAPVAATPTPPDDKLARHVARFRAVAAVSGRFDPHAALTVREKASRRAVLNRVASDFVVETLDGQLRWRMRPTPRADELRRLNAAGGLTAVVDSAAADTDEYGRVLREVIRRGAGVPLAGRSAEWLRQLRGVVEDLSGSGLPTPDASDVHRHLDAGAFAREFLPPVTPFVGRRKQLADLRRFLSAPAGPTTGGSLWSAMTLSGLGGAGKSALLTHFLAEVYEAKSATLVVFDFDRPGIDAGDTVWLRSELARQVGLQYPQVADDLRTARQQTRETQAKLARHSTPGEQSSQVRTSDDLLDRVRRALADVQADRRPVLMVLDTLEVLMTGEAQGALLQWIDSVADILAPTPLKVLLSGRLFDDALAAFEARAGEPPMTLDALPPAAAKSLLSKCGVTDRLAGVLAKKHWLPRRPLELRLLARLATDSKLTAADLERDLRDGTPDLAAGIIYGRVLKRLKGVTGLLAAPGLVLRFVTPELLREVLVPALDLPPMTPADARAALTRLAAHSWLVTREGADRVRHRRDLRRSMIRLMTSDDPKVAEQLKLPSPEVARRVSRHAVAYFEDPAHPDPAEAMYHTLLWVKHPEDGALVELSAVKAVAPSVGQDVDDLPPAGAALFRFATRKGVPASDVELLPAQHFRSAYGKTGERLVRTREFGQALRFIDRMHDAQGRSGSFEWERDALFATAEWDRLRDETIGLSVLGEQYPKVRYHMAVLGEPTPDGFTPQWEREFRAAFREKRPEVVSLTANALLLLVADGETVGDPVRQWLTTANARDLSPLVRHRLELLKRRIGAGESAAFGLTPSLLPLRREVLHRLAGVRKLKRVRALFTDLLDTLEGRAAKRLTTRTLLSAVDAMYKHEELWKKVELRIGDDIEPDLLRGPDVEFRDPVRFALLAEFADPAGREQLAAMIQAQIEIPLADLAPTAFAEALRVDAEHALETPVELVDRAWRLGDLLTAVTAARPRSARLRRVRDAHRRWDSAVSAALRVTTS